MKFFTSIGITATVLASLIVGTGTATAIPRNADYPHVRPFCWGAGASAFECPTVSTIVFDPKEYGPYPPPSSSCLPPSEGVIDNCVMGNVTSEKKIALVGSSHGRVMWPAMEALAERADASVSFFLKNGCHYMTTTDTMCANRNLGLRNKLRDHTYDLVIFIQGVDTNESGSEVVSAANYLPYLRELKTARVPFVVVKDGPWLTNTEMKCLAKNKKKPSKCTIARSVGFRYSDFAVEAAESLRTPVVDLSDLYCDDTTCPLVRGGMRIYQDTHHLVPGFAKTFAPFLWNELVELDLLPFTD